jgi:ATP-dependent exoDNAse (exonuclease V) alpha subunit
LVAGRPQRPSRQRDDRSPACRVAELNAVAHAILDREGQLGRKRLRLANGIELAAGDRVVCTRNDRGLGVTNGSRGTVTAVDPAARTVVLELDERRRLKIAAAYPDAGHLNHAYALTGHKTQGLTLEQAFVLTDGHGALKEWGYVALTRARGQTRLYTTAAEREPDAPPHRPEPAGPVDRLAQALARPAAEPLAIDRRRSAMPRGAAVVRYQGRRAVYGGSRTAARPASS